MTRGVPVSKRAVMRSLRAAAADARDDGGGWHASTLADELGVCPDAVRTRLRELADEGRVVRVHGFGPVQPRVSYLPADHPDAEGSDA